MSGATGPPTPSLEVKQASYVYSQNNMTDITAQTKNLVKDGNLNLTVGANAFGIQNPSPGTKNTFSVLLSVNGGSPMNFEKEDGQVFDFKAPSLKDKEEKNHASVLGMSIYYFFLALVGMYIVYSSFRLFSEGMQISWLGYAVGGLLLSFFLALAASGKAGIFGLLVSSPMYLMYIPMIVFVVVCYNYIMYQTDGINFSYAKAAEAIKNAPEIPYGTGV
jgi:hypothetical protein